MQHHGAHTRRTQSALDRGKHDATSASSLPQKQDATSHASASRHESKVVPASGPQRSLEYPQPGQQNVTDGRAHVAAPYFQRQDSCPMMRGDRGHGPTYSRDLAGGRGGDPGQYQDVSQITAVQVTPRPKPRAFPRTNPSYVSVHRRDGNSSAFRHVDTMAASAFNHGYQLRGPPAGVERTANSGRYYPSASGAQTLQTSHSYLGSESGRRLGGIHDDVDSDSSVSSSSSDASGHGPRRQSTLDSKPARHPAPRIDQSAAVESRSGAAGLVGISAATSRHPGSGPTTHDQNRSSESSPLVDQGPRQHRLQRHAKLPKSEPEIPAQPRGGGIPNGVVRPSTARRNSEPDYVNFPPKSESHKLTDLHEGIAVVARSTPRGDPTQKSVGAVTEPIGVDEMPRSGDGTLRIRNDVSSAPDYVNYQDIVSTSSSINSGQPPPVDGNRHSFLASEY